MDPRRSGVFPVVATAAVGVALACALWCACGPAPERTGPAGGGAATAPASPSPVSEAPSGATPLAPAPSGDGGAYASGDVPGAGALSGRVLYKGTPRPPKAIEPTKDRAVCGATAHRSEDLLVGKNGGLRNAVVSIGPVPRGKPWPSSGKPTLDQHGCWFIPHVQVIPAGAEIDVVNSDGILHNIHTYPKQNTPTNVAQPKFKKVIQLSFSKPDIVGVKCDVHSWMSAWMVIAPHPYFAVTDEGGAFSLTDVPPGTYTLTTWHESLGTREQSITVAPGGASEISIEYAE